ncbi:MAG: DUF6206 family protein, partial [Thermodesulfobacteriota bacterium]|nr:DUF6206 family protein [Thermodesulfobacteriota bacterium]
MIEKTIDLQVLNDFEKGLDPRHPERSTIPARIIGYGEMSTIFEINLPSLDAYAFKRMPIFRSKKEIDDYQILYREYNRLIHEDIGVCIPESTSVRMIPNEGNMVLYIVQRKLPVQSICDCVIKGLDDRSVEDLVALVLREMKKVFEFNASGGNITIGFDGQISNWAIKDYDGSGLPRIDENTQFYFIDTSTPLMSEKGIEKLNPDLFLRSAPSFMVWLIKWFFLKGVMTRYYDFHLVAVDLIANFYKEQRADLIPSLIERTNRFFEEEARELDTDPITQKEVISYYREDALIWSLYLNLRRFDRFLHANI